MSIARTKIKGLVLLNSRTTVPGFTLFTPVNDKAVYLIDNRGEVVREWKLAEKPASGGRLLPNGNLLVLLQDPESLVLASKDPAAICRKLTLTAMSCGNIRTPLFAP